MEMRDIIALANAGYTKQEIQNMMGNAQPIQNIMGNAQPIQNIMGNVQTPQNVMGNVQTPQNVMGNVQTPQNVMGNVQTPQNVMGNVQPMQNIDYKTLYETQRKMLEDMQTLNISGTKGAPIDTPMSVVNDFLGGEK